MVFIRFKPSNFISLKSGRIKIVLSNANVDLNLLNRGSAKGTLDREIISGQLGAQVKAMS